MINDGILRRAGRAGQRVGLFVVAGALLLARPSSIAAHEIPASVRVRMEVARDTSALRVVVRVPLESIRDIDFPLQPGSPYVDFTRADSLAAQAVDTWLLPYITVAADGREVPGRMLAARLTPRGAQLPVQSIALEAELLYPVPASAQVTIDPRLARLGVRTHSVVTFVKLDGSRQVFEYTGDPGVLRTDPRWHHAASRFLVLGFGHILDGIDHLLFVLCLVLPFRKLRPLIGIVTAFTVAHSMTLLAASLGWVPDALWFPPLVETLIAASIAWMAVENIVMATAKAQAPPLQRRWLMAFGFGLIHGFGFSFALRESLQFAGSHLTMALLSFNVGVEIGQVAVLLVALPVLSLLFSNVVREQVGIVIISAFVTHTTWHWLGERWSALRQYDVDWSLAGLLPVIRVAMALAIGVGIAAILGRLVRLRTQRQAEPSRNFGQ
jgi:hypothetical protein